MTPGAESLYKQITRFTNGSVAGLLQLLVAAARRNTFQRIIACPTYPVPAKSLGLSLAVGQLREAMVHPDVNVSTFLARLYASVRTIEHRKRAGQFFTAEMAAEWALSIAPLVPSDDVCDAGAGTAVFADAILRKGGSVRSYIGVENDPTLLLCAAHVFESISAPKSYKLLYANFLLLRQVDFKANGLRVPTVIIANPPFVRFHNLTGRARMRAAVKSSIGVMLSPLSGSGCYFISRAAEIAGTLPSSSSGDTPNGRLIFFLPKEAAGAAHVRRLRDDLESMHGWRCRQFTIPNMQTGIDRHPSNALALLFIFEQMKVKVGPHARQSTPAVCVQDVLRIKRGISTGCNEFFVLTDEEVRRRKISQQYLREVLPTRIPITGNRFLRVDWELLRRSNRPCWLLALPNGDISDFEPSIQEYLKEGLERGVHETPTAKSFRMWFSIPVPPEPPDAFVTYMFRGASRFVLNRARVLHLTNILGGRFASPAPDSERQGMIIDSLNKQAESWVEGNLAGREYKGGLIKIEPRELSKLPIDVAVSKLLDRESLSSKVPCQSLFE
jgi:predicted RNA methylase